jgi:hypothetical protein
MSKFKLNAKAALKALQRDIKKCEDINDDEGASLSDYGSMIDVALLQMRLLETLLLNKGDEIAQMEF